MSRAKTPRRLSRLVWGQGVKSDLMHFHRELVLGRFFTTTYYLILNLISFRIVLGSKIAFRSIAQSLFFSNELHIDAK